jgi:predicted secreted protein
MLSHCLLNENVRYLGGATGSGATDQVVDDVRASGIGICQVPCPEQRVWGGVLKRRMYLGLGADHTGFRRIRRLLTPIALAYVRWQYGRLARHVATQVADYRSSGYEVVGVVGVDGSPSCGVRRTLDLHRAIDALAACDPTSIDAASFNDRVVFANVARGEGLFIGALRRELRRRGLAIPFLAHDMIAEIRGDRPNRP